MKNIPIALQADYEKPTGGYAYLAKVVTTQNEVYGFTTLDDDIRFDDGFHNVLYDCESEMRPQNVRGTSDTTADSTDLLGWFNKQLENKIIAGMFSRAELTIYRVSYLNLQYGAELIAYGTVGEIEYGDVKSKRKIEFVSLKGQLQQVVNDLYSLTCRADFGDKRCGMPFVWSNATVSTVGDSPYLNFNLTGLTQPSGTYEFGVVEFLSGPNTGFTMEVESSILDTGITNIQLSFMCPFPVTPGTLVRIREDCGKTEFDCITYGNIINMRAEHLTPVEEAGVMVPGAYIKSQGAQ